MIYRGIPIAFVIGAIMLMAVIWHSASADPTSRITKTLTWHVPANAAPGIKTVTILATNDLGSTVTKTLTIKIVATATPLVTSTPPTPTPSPTVAAIITIAPTPLLTPTPSAQPSANPTSTSTPTPSATPTITPNPITVVVSTNSESSASSNSGSSEDSQPSRPTVKKGRVASTQSTIYQVETGHTISGSYSGIEPSGTTVVLAHSRAIAEKKIVVPKGNYILEVQSRDDKPGPVKMTVYLNNKSWKTITFDKSDNKYRTHIVGTLKNFSGGTIRFKFLNDAFNPKEPANADMDRNLHLDWWRLTNL